AGEAVDGEQRAVHLFLQWREQPLILLDPAARLLTKQLVLGPAGIQLSVDFAQAEEVAGLAWQSAVAGRLAPGVFAQQATPAEQADLCGCAVLPMALLDAIDDIVHVIEV